MVSQDSVWRLVNPRLRVLACQMPRRSLRTMLAGCQRRHPLRGRLEHLRLHSLRRANLAALGPAPAQLLVRHPARLLIRRLLRQPLHLRAARRMLKLPKLELLMRRLLMRLPQVHRRGLQLRSPRLLRKSRDRPRLMRLGRRTQIPLGRATRQHPNRVRPSGRPEHLIR
jgi:hypothetical protein